MKRNEGAVSGTDELAALQQRLNELETENATLRARIERQESLDHPSRVLQAGRRAQHYLDVAGVILMVVNADQRVQLINRQGCEILGRPEAEILGKNWFDYFVPESQREQVRAGFVAQINRPASDTSEEMIQHQARPVMDAQGQQRFIDWRAVPIRDDEGEVQAFLSSGTDVTERVQAEAALRASEERYRLLADHSSDVIATLDLDRNLTYISPAVERLLGYTQAEMMGMDLAEILSPASTRVGLEAVRKLTPGDGPLRIEVEAQHRDGSLLWVEIMVVLLLDEQNEVNGFLATARDVTERQTTMAALRESELRFRQLAENVRDIFWVTTPKFDQCFYVSPAYDEVWGRDHRWLTEHPDDWWSGIHPEDLERTKAYVETPVAERPVEVEYRVVRPDQSIRWLRDRYYPVLDETGNCVRLVGISEDITNRVEMDRALQASNKRFQAIFHHAPQGLALIEADGRFSEVNPAFCQMFGYSAQELRGMEATTLLPEVMRAEMRDGSEDRLSNQVEKVRDIVCCQRRDGEEIWVDLAETRFWDPVYQAKVSLGVLVDITERWEARVALEASEQRYRELYRMIRLMADNVPDLIWAKDLENRYLFTNQAICDKLLMARDTDEPIGKTDLYFALRERAAHKDRPDWHTFGEIGEDSDQLVKTRRRPQRFDEYGNVRAEFLFLDVYKAPFWNKEGQIIGTVGCGRIVTHEKEIEAERSRVQEELRASLAEKDMLLREVHHRVKNNLQVISSLLKLQARVVQDPAAVEALLDCQGRVRTMALVHDTLHRSRDLATVDLIPYLNSLGSHLFQMYRERDQLVRYQVLGEPTLVSLDTAIPCGLITNELVSNALRHAFSGRGRGQVWVMVENEGNAHTLIVADDGVGLPEDVDIRRTHSLGLQLVTSLVDQIRGSIEVESNDLLGSGAGGTLFRIRFSDPA